MKGIVAGLLLLSLLAAGCSRQPAGTERDRVGSQPAGTDETRVDNGAVTPDGAGQAPSGSRPGQGAAGSLPPSLVNLSMDPQCADLPRTIEVARTTGDGGSPVTYRLINPSFLPFSIYVPNDYGVIPLQGFSWKITGIPPDVDGLTGLLIGRSAPGQGWGWDPRLDIAFFRPGMSEEEAKRDFEIIVDSFAAQRQLDRENGTPPWSLSAYQVEDAAGEDGDAMVGNAVLGRYQERYFFVLFRRSPGREAEGDAVLGDIFEQWRWRGNCTERPPFREITTFPEGMEQTDTFRLVDDPDLPFTTYIPDTIYDFEPATAGPAVGVRIGNRSSIPELDMKVMRLEVLFYPEGTERGAAERAFMDAAGAGEDRRIEDSGLSWPLSAFSLTDLPGRCGAAYLGRYRDRYFHVVDIINCEAGDGWGPVSRVIFDEWRWRESGLPFEDGLGE